MSCISLCEVIELSAFMIANLTDIFKSKKKKIKSIW